MDFATFEGKIKQKPLQNVNFQNKQIIKLSILKEGNLVKHFASAILCLQFADWEQSSTSSIVCVHTSTCTLYFLKPIDHEHASQCRPCTLIKSPARPTDLKTSRLIRFFMGWEQWQNRLSFLSVPMHVPHAQPVRKDGQSVRRVAQDDSVWLVCQSVGQIVRHLNFHYKFYFS